MLQFLCRQQGDLWFRFRADPARLTATQLASVLHAGYPSKSCASVYRDKRNARFRPYVPVPQHPNEAMRHGIEYEPLALQYWSERTGKKWERCGMFTKGVLSASPDAVVPEEGDTLTTLEIKCPYNTEDHLPRTPEEVEDAYVVQVLAAIEVTGAREGQICFYDAYFPAFSACYSVSPLDDWKPVLDRVGLFFDAVRSAETRTMRKTDEDGEFLRQLRERINVVRLW